MNAVKSLFKLVIETFSFIVVYRITIGIIRRLHPFPVPPFIGRFLDSRYRRMIQPPGPIIERSGIKPGMKVLEVGCGSGGYTTFVARTVGEEGEVYALDIQRAMLDQLENKLAKPEHSDLTNIKLVEKSAYELPFDDNTFDVIYMITVLQEIPEPQKALEEARRVVKPEGRVAVTEFLPDPDYVLSKTTAKIGEAAGFKVDAILGNLWTYTVRFQKNEFSSKLI